MTEREAIEAIYQQWQSGWEAIHPNIVGDPARVPYTFMREDFSADSLGVLGTWARVSVAHTTAAQITFGNVGTRKFERRGNVFVQLFAPVGQGVGLLATLAGDARKVLEGKRLGELNLNAARTEEIPDESTWASVTIIVPFRYGETR